MDKQEWLTRRDGGGGISVENLPAALERLAAYEDAEEQGRLVRLPCKVGTRLYHVAKLTDKVTEYTVDGFEVYETVSYLVLQRYGERKSVPVACLRESYFFTSAEAEAALQEREEAAGNGA